MPNSLLFIPDISGFTEFVQNTEIEHSRHVIAELLEVLINANTQDLLLAEIEGDALFFYRENYTPSQEQLLAQFENMFTAFYSHLKILEKNRVCSCSACATAPKLQLKIVAHSGSVQFIDVHNTHKPFGEAVIVAHRLLKNSINSDNYVLISGELADGIGLSSDYKSMLFQFESGQDTYDSKEIQYHFAQIVITNLKLKSFQEPKHIMFNCPPNLVFEKQFPVSASELLEKITNYKYRHDWVDGVDEFIYDEDEVTRLGTEHTCVINGKHLDFITVSKKGKPGQIVYGELTKSVPIADEVYQFYILTPIDGQNCVLTLEVFWRSKSPIKKLLMTFFGKPSFKKSAKKGLEALLVFSQKK